MQQLNIFNDSRDRVLVNQLAEAIIQADLAASRAAHSALQCEFADDRHLPAGARLIEHLAAEAQSADTPLADHAAAVAARSALAGPVHEAAHTLLGHSAAAGWLAARWCALARRAGALPYLLAQADAHAAALFITGRSWADAAQAVAGIESWRRQPQALDWMVQARWRLQGADATWPLLAELAWIAPQRLPGLLAGLGDLRLGKLMRAFEAFDALEGIGPGDAVGAGAGGANVAAAWHWWPAWLLVEQPLLAAPLDGAQTAGVVAPERAFKLLQSLLRLERQGRHHDIVALRRELQSLHRGLFAAYMAPR